MKPARPVFRRRIYALHGSYRFIDPRWQSALSESELHDPAQWNQVDLNDIIIDSDTTQVYRVLTDAGAVVFKRYRLGRSWRYFLRPGRAACEWAGLNALQSAGIPVPDLVAFGEDRSAGRLINGYIITREVSPVMDLENYATAVWYGLPPKEKSSALKAIRSKLFNLVKLAHSRQLFHRDLHWRNILIGEENGEFLLWWIDCPRFSRGGFRREHDRMVDLSCLARVALSVLSRTERFRSLLLFVEGDRRQARRLFREIEAHHRRSKHPPRIFDPAERLRADG